MVELTDKNYEKLLKSEESPAIIVFYSKFCGPCQDLEAFMKDNIRDYASSKDVRVLRCNVSKNLNLSKKFKVESVPFTIGLTKQKELVLPSVGLRDAQYYYDLVDKVSGKRKKFLGIF